ncbi:DUF1616 domain-containing protein [Haloarcula montana]|uniref:DUF1616 domain-containing protein n=1 Tax=Haloarcula montana TaxID=3111776 RepID=UPI002D77E20F|nr:DUF1616 domain-containing protein [Haloarcula sp. GH36]
MDDKSDGRYPLRFLLPGPLRRFPADLAVAAVIPIVTLLCVVVPGLSATPLRIVFGIPSVLIIPGYVVVAALFPGGDTLSASADQATDTNNVRIGMLERGVLSFGGSIIVVPTLGFATQFTPWALAPLTVFAVLTLFTLLFTVIAAIRRQSVPAADRFRVEYQTRIRRARATVSTPASSTERLLDLLLIASVLFACAGLVYVAIGPIQSSTSSEFYVGERDDAGDLVTDGYPRTVAVGENFSVVVGAQNNEREPIQYTVVVEAQQVTFRANDTVVLDEREVGRFSSPVVRHNESWERRHTSSFRTATDDLRVTYLLYRGEAPPNPTVDNAYRTVHLWITVEPSP